MIVDVLIWWWFLWTVDLVSDLLEFCLLNNGLIVPAVVEAVVAGCKSDCNNNEEADEKLLTFKCKY